MIKHVAFLRGMGLGKRRPQGSELVSIFAGLGHSEVVSFMASGNVIFSSGKRDTVALEKASSQALEKQLGYKVDVFVRTADAVAAIARSIPFSDEDPSAINVHVAFLSEVPAPATAKALAAVQTEYDRFKVSGREFYWLCRGNLSASSVWERPEVKKLRLPNSTMRNMRTLQKLTAKYLQG